MAHITDLQRNDDEQMWEFHLTGAVTYEVTFEEIGATCANSHQQEGHFAAEQVLGTGTVRLGAGYNKCEHKGNPSFQFVAADCDASTDATFKNPPPYNPNEGWNKMTCRDAAIGPNGDSVVTTFKDQADGIYRITVAVVSA